MKLAFWPLFLLLLSLFLVFDPPSACAEDYFLTIGGGPNPSSNQISLEKNVQFFQRTLKAVRQDNPPHTIFFADGKLSSPDLQYRDEQQPPSEAVQWMCRLFGDEDSTDLRYRDHQIQSVRSPSRKVHIKQSLYELAEKLRQDDRLLIYVTGHGGPAVGDGDYYSDYVPTNVNTFDTSIALWNNQTLQASEFATWLDRFDKDVKIVLIMAQCYSGGFAHTIYHDSHRKHGLSPAQRCGFFSQRHDRPAAGCTPDIDEANYREYSTYFWEAIAGKKRAGDEPVNADYDEDQFISFAEAHAYAILASDTIDIPIATSDGLLRRYSEIAAAADKDDEKQQESGGFLGSLFGGADKASDDDQAVPSDKLLSRAMTLEQTCQMARPEQQAIIKTLAKELDLDLTKTVEDAKRLSRKLQKKQSSLESDWLGANAEVRIARTGLTNAVVRQWPSFLADGFQPRMMELASSRGDEFVKFIKAQPQTDA
ncbi:MAG: C13 family peptidase, partial [Pirellulales bacterium]|nr:C13 family peptidase [Pirellulales bacterium]